MASSKQSSRRPKFMRASATCPQLATSNASRKDLATLHSCGAKTILNRVASYSAAQCGRSGEISVRPSEGRRKDDGFEGAVVQSGSYSYFSFPSFEEFEEWKVEERREGDVSG